MSDYLDRFIHIYLTFLAFVLLALQFGFANFLRTTFDLPTVAAPEPGIIGTLTTVLDNVTVIIDLMLIGPEIGALTFLLFGLPSILIVMWLIKIAKDLIPGT